MDSEPSVFQAATGGMKPNFGKEANVNLLAPQGKIPLSGLEFTVES